jgi:hypothetical protein
VGLLSFSVFSSEQQLHSLLLPRSQPAVFVGCLSQGSLPAGFACERWHLVGCLLTASALASASDFLVDCLPMGSDLVLMNAELALLITMLVVVCRKITEELVQEGIHPNHRPASSLLAPWEFPMCCKPASSRLAFEGILMTSHFAVADVCPRAEKLCHPNRYACVSKLELDFDWEH